MLREPVLNTKRSQLGKCVASRKRKLSELYSVAATVNATVTTSPSHHGSETLSKFTKDQFEDANDITKGRLFDVATLLRIPGFASQLVHAPTAIQNDGDSIGFSISLAPVAKGTEKESYIQNGGLDDDEDMGSAKGRLHISRPPTPASSDRMEGIIEGAVSESDKQDDTGQKKLDHIVDASRRTEGSGLPSPDPREQDAQLSQPQRRDVGTDDSSTHRQSGGIQERHGGGAVSSVQDKISVPSTPDAQLRHEAAQFKDSRAQTTMDASTQGQSRDSSSQGSVQTGPTAASTPSETTKPSDDATIAARRHGVPQDQRMAVMTNDNSRDVMLSQRPPMRIDTTISRPPPSIDTATPGSTFTPTKSGIRSSPPERPRTRVSSGAIRHKSVSEILGETPKTATHSGDKTPYDVSESNFLSRRSSLVASPESASFKSRFGDLKDREKDRSKLSTVVFARQQAGDAARNGKKTAGQLFRRGKSDEEKDYLVPLFAAQAVAQTPSLDELIKNANKTLSTSNWYVHYEEMQDCRILKRIYHLQNSNRWALRQIERSVEPPRPTTHWDMLLNEVKWMRTDFREERKWKIAAAKNLAEACAEWVQAPEDVRPALQIKTRKPIPKPAAIEDRTTPVSTSNDMDTKPDATPELVPSADDDMSDAAEEIPVVDLSRANAPAALFALSAEDVLFSLDKTPAADKLLSELPLYQPFVDPRGTKRSCGEMLDEAWRKPLVPVSKFSVGKLVINGNEPVRKKSRYEYTKEDDTEFDPNGSAMLPLDQAHDPVSPEKDDVALFNAKNKHIIARLHAAHAFRPPSEFPMPVKPFFESRHPSQWTQAEDDELRRLVRQYEYNWSLISACLSSPSLFSSGAERRTPWECFERWESFEGLPGDMDKHSYFRAWKSRRNDAKQHLEQLYNLAQQAGNTVAVRRRTAEPVAVERRRSNKHLALIHAMSKVAKKKETALQKSQHAASMAAMRKASEPTQKKMMGIRTPKEFSDHKHEQEQQFKEKQMLYRQQVAANQRALQKAQQAGQQQANLAVPPTGRMPMPSQMNGTSPRLASSLPHGVTQAGGRPLPPSQAMLNNMAPNMNSQNGAMNMRVPANISQQQMQAYLQNHQRLASQGGQDSTRVLMEASRLQEQQRLMQQRQIQSQPPGANGVQSPHGSNANGQMQGNAAMMGNMQPNGKPSSSNGHPGHQRNSSSPSMTGHGQGQPLSSGVVPVFNQIQNSIRAMHPHLPQEQVQKMATESLNRQFRNHNSQAGNSMQANGNPAHMPQGMNFNPSMNPQMYAQIMRSQQASQQNRNGTDTNGVRPESRGGATPKGNVANGSSQSPRPPQAQVASST